VSEDIRAVGVKRSLWSVS